MASIRFAAFVIMWNISLKYIQSSFIQFIICSRKRHCLSTTMWNSHNPFGPLKQTTNESFYTFWPHDSFWMNWILNHFRSTLKNYKIPAVAKNMQKNITCPIDLSHCVLHTLTWCMADRCVCLSTWNTERTECGDKESEEEVGGGGKQKLIYWIPMIRLFSVRIYAEMTRVNVN